MYIIPAIDMIGGKCVRLTEGDYSSKKIYDDDPLKIALQFKEAGARIIHMVDLDNARLPSGGDRLTASDNAKSPNREMIKLVKKETGLVVETGGGIRTTEDVKELLDAGIDYLILGTILTEDLDIVSRWMDMYKGRFIAGIDVKDGIVRTKGWETDSGIDAAGFGRKLKALGFEKSVFTDIKKDGRLEGPNIDDTINFSKATGLDVILSGGISSMDDIKKVVETGCQGIFGIITGKAIYEGKIDLKQAVKEFQNI